MSAQEVPAVSAAAEPAIADLTLEEALVNLSSVETYLDLFTPQVVEAQRARKYLRETIQMLMVERGARRIEQSGWRARFTKKKIGNATVYDAAKLRRVLSGRSDVPHDAIAEALPLEQPPEFVKPDLRRVRKLAEYGSDVAGIIRNHIVEATEIDVLEIERVAIDVTPSQQDGAGVLS